MSFKPPALIGLFALGGLLFLGNRALDRGPRPIPVVTGPTATAVFAGGCFWSIEKLFDEMDGVVSATSGFTGGNVKNPSYEEVSSGRTGHMEAVKVVYDPAKVTYARLLDAFWHDIDPTSPNGQFCDFGTQYRTAIFYQDEAQHQAILASKTAIEQSKALDHPIATQVLRETPFYPAEAYHQDYARRNPVGYGSYRIGCGRDAKLDAVWGKLAYHSTN
ncbi:MAG: peptide-methionine (S)-S-oxide reductase MsrA [Gemmatimonadota bacterium]